jgi:hypothetical protein
MNYKEALQHPMWQKKRLEVLEAREWKCQDCLASDQQLHVHHLLYEKGKQPWEYDNALLAVLCANCHEREHRMRTQIDRILTFARPGEVLPLLAGLVAAQLMCTGKNNFPLPRGELFTLLEQSPKLFGVGMEAGKALCEQDGVYPLQWSLMQDFDEYLAHA